MAACELHELADASGLAPEAREESDGRDRHLARFRGRAMHDRWISYDAYAGAHSLCGAHLLRDCLYLAEQEQQVWAAEMADHLLAMHHAAQEWRLQGASCVPRMERDEWVTHYFEILLSG